MFSDVENFLSDGMYSQQQNKTDKNSSFEKHAQSMIWGKTSDQYNWQVLTVDQPSSRPCTEFKRPTVKISFPSSRKYDVSRGCQYTIIEGISNGIYRILYLEHMCMEKCYKQRKWHGQILVGKICLWNTKQLYGCSLKVKGGISNVVAKAYSQSMNFLTIPSKTFILFRRHKEL